MHILDTTREAYNNRNPFDGCFFCTHEIIEHQECTKFQFEYWMVLVNKHPYMNGNVMLVLKRHVINTEELTSEEWGEFGTALVEVQSVLGKMFNTDSFNVGINLGPDSGQSVSHLHWQIIPRKRKNHTVVGVLADIHVVTLSPDKLKEQLSK